MIKSIYQGTGVVMINYSKKEAVFPPAKFIEMIFLDELYNREQYYISSIKRQQRTGYQRITHSNPS